MGLYYVYCMWLTLVLKKVFCSTGPLLPFPSLFLNRKSYSRDGHLYCPYCHRARLPDGQDQGDVLKNCKLANSLSSREYQDQAKKVKDIWILRHLKKILKREKNCRFPCDGRTSNWLLPRRRFLKDQGVAVSGFFKALSSLELWKFK